MSGSDISLSKAARTRFALLGGGILAAATAVAAVAAAPASPPSRYFTATFERAGQGLDDRSRVKVRGMSVGSVVSVGLDERGRARVRLRVDEEVRVPATVSAAVEPVSVFGPKDIALDLGQGEGVGPFLESGAVITRTTGPAELSETGEPLAELAAAIDPDDVSTVVHTLAEALRGNGEKLRRTTDNGQKVLDVLHGNRKDTRQALKDAAALAEVFGSRTETIDGLLGDAAALNETLTEDPEGFERTLENAGVLADALSGTLKDNGDDLALLIDKGSLFSDSLHSRQGELLELINGLDGFFGGLASIMQLPGPEGTLLGNTNLYVSLNLCDELPDLCPPQWTYTDKDDPQQRRHEKRKGNG
ncbi:MCE family protein [Actinocorallia populi]|uniref:MCE family protein n=1 Tax=Actinocorallia populi TaxID=2079200 RepID=UPI000D088D85|nr:MlaD family protein [Actinocorallia populi]